MLFEYLCDNFMIEGERSINSSRNNLLDKVNNLTWNINPIEILIETPDDNVFEQVLQE